MTELTYRWEQVNDSGYETLFRPDGSEVTTITEPEDRCGYRDLAPIVAELDALSARLAEQRIHYVVTGDMHDAAKGLLHGCCSACAVPWPCPFAESDAQLAAYEADDTKWAGTTRGQLQAQLASLQEEHAATLAADVEALNWRDAEIERLRDALSLFATYAGILDAMESESEIVLTDHTWLVQTSFPGGSIGIAVGDLRKARAALSTPEEINDQTTP